MGKTTDTMRTHVVERTSSQGGPFVGKCSLCGASGLTMGDALKPCANPFRVAFGDALLDVLHSNEVCLTMPDPVTMAAPNLEDAMFQDELQSLINRHSQENASNTPDFILAQYLVACLAAWNTGVQQRETWYRRDARPPIRRLMSDA